MGQQHEPEVECEYLSVKQACRLMGVARSTSYRLLSDRTTGFESAVVRVPGINRLRIIRSRLVDWMGGHASLRQWRAAFSLGMVDLEWPDDEPRVLMDEYLVQ